MLPRRRTTVVLLPERRPTKRLPGRGVRGGGKTGGLDALYGLVNHCKPDFEAKEDRQTYGTSSRI